MKKIRNRTWMCAKCRDEDGIPMEFKTDEAYYEHNKRLHSGIPTKPQPQKPVKQELTTPKPVIKEKPKLVELVYKYIGLCPQCGKGVDTIPLDIDARTKNQIIVCWCNDCKIKIKQREVLKL